VGGGNLRPFESGPEVNKYGIVAIGHTERTNTNIKVFWLVMQSSHSNEVPHDVNLDVRLSSLKNASKRPSARAWQVRDAANI